MHFLVNQIELPVINETRTNKRKTEDVIPIKLSIISTTLYPDLRPAKKGGPDPTSEKKANLIDILKHCIITVGNKYCN